MNKHHEDILLSHFGMAIDEQHHVQIAELPHRGVLTNGVDTRMWQKKITEADEVEEMVWKMDEKEEASRPEYEAFLRGVMDKLAQPGDNRMVYIVHDRETLLSTTSALMGQLPVVFHGTTDVLVGSSADIATLMSTPTSETPETIGKVRLLFELKKKIETESHHRACQATGELFAAGTKSTDFVFVVLTHLKKEWMMQWPAKGDGDTQVLRRVWFASKKDALTAIASVLKSTEADLDGFRCAKVRQLVVASDSGERKADD